MSVRHAVHSFLRGESAGPLAALLRLPLIPIGVCFGELAALRVRLYERGVLRSQPLPVPVISVGNLTLGGTGKTPFVRTLVGMLEERGERPLVLARGYGAHAPGDELDEEGRSLARDLFGVRVVQGRDRAAAVRPHLAGGDPPTVIVLDDGAQHRQIARSIEIMLVDATCPFGAGWPLPAGSLREFPGALGRADLIVITRSDEIAERELAALSERIAELSGVRPVTARHQPCGLLPGDESPEILVGRRVGLVSGIASPESFHETVRRIGAAIVLTRVHDDHHEFTARDVKEVEREAMETGADMILATGKDEPKVASLLGSSRLPWKFLEVDVDLDPEGRLALDRTLDDVLARHVRPRGS